MNEKEKFIKLLDDELKYLNNQLVFDPDLDGDVKYCINRIQKLREKVKEEKAMVNFKEADEIVIAVCPECRTLQALHNDMLLGSLFYCNNCKKSVECLTVLQGKLFGHK